MFIFSIFTPYFQESCLNYIRKTGLYGKSFNYIVKVAKVCLKMCLDPDVSGF